MYHQIHWCLNAASVKDLPELTCSWECDASFCCLTWSILTRIVKTMSVLNYSTVWMVGWDWLTKRQITEHSDSWGVRHALRRFNRHFRSYKNRLGVLCLWYVNCMSIVCTHARSHTHIFTRAHIDKHPHIHAHTHVCKCCRINCKYDSQLKFFLLFHESWLNVSFH